MRSPVPCLVALALAAALVVGCQPDAPTTPSARRGGVAAAGTTTAAERTTAAARWNALVGEIVSRRPGGPLVVARTFALVSVAQHDAILAAEDARHGREQPSRAGAAAGAAAAVLAAIFPVERPRLDAQLAADAAYFPTLPSERRDDFAAGVAIGRAVAARVLVHAASDGGDAVWTGSVPTDAGGWVSAPPPAQPLSPLWGKVRPWLMTSGDQFRPPPPPAPGSPDFVAALAEVRRLSDTRTPEQLAVAQRWGALVGTPGPIGYWSDVGLALAARHHFDERRTARLLAVMHMATMDASIACWDAKYAYWYVRPWQADPAITTPVFRPNFPAYPSAHSCFSAAAAGVLEGFFPAARDELRAGVAEAGDARIWGGVHFRFDVTAGQQIGYDVAALALRLAPHGHQTIVVE